MERLKDSQMVSGYVTVILVIAGYLATRNVQAMENVKITHVTVAVMVSGESSVRFEAVQAVEKTVPDTDNAIQSPVNVCAKTAGQEMTALL